MSQVEFRCPHCAGVFKAPASLEGEYNECPKCKKDVDRWPAPISKPRPQPEAAPTAAAVSVIPKVPTQQAVWYYMVGDKRRGPVTEAQLKALAESASLRPTDLVWRDGVSDWFPASQLPWWSPNQPAAQSPATRLPPAIPQPLELPFSEPPPPASGSAGQPAQREMKECTYCSEFIPVRAKKCPVCGYTIDVAMREAEEARATAERARREAEIAREEAEEAREEARRERRRRRPHEVHYHERRRPECPHALHLLLTILTLGVWLPVWIIHWIIVEAS